MIYMGRIQILGNYADLHCRILSDAMTFEGYYNNAHFKLQLLNVFSSLILL